MVLGVKKEKINKYLFINMEIISNSFSKVLLTMEKMWRNYGKNVAKN